MTSSLTSSSNTEPLDLETVTLKGRCKTHGDWAREELKSLSSRLSGKCPECEKPPQPIRIGMVDLVGSCEAHGAWERKVPKMLADKIAGKCPTCEQAAEADRAVSEAAKLQSSAKSKKARNIAKLLEGSEIPRRFQGRSFDNYRAEGEGQLHAFTKAKAFAEHFPRAMELGASFVFCGKPGTGKTHLACAIGNHVMQTFGHSVAFVTVFEAIQRVKATYGDSSKSESDVMRSFAQVDLLILDEVGVQFGTKYEEVIITDIINRRYADMRPTIILSNLNSDELSEYLGARVVDRMFEGGGGVLAFDWDSYRTKVAKDKDLPQGEYLAPSWMQVD
jgi:DNA replication protein DnaC